MEFVSIAMSVLISLLSPAGLAVDRVLEDAIRSQVSSVEDLDIRVDNTPTWQLLQGKISQVRIAGTGVHPIPAFRIEQIALETDPIDVDVRSLRQGRVRLDEPLQSGVAIAVTAADVNQWVQSPQLLEGLRNFGINLLPTPQAIQAQRYSLIDPEVAFLDDRLRVAVAIQDDQTLDNVALQLESGFAIEQGRSLQLVNPSLLVNGEPAPRQFTDALAAGINRSLDLRTLAPDGITVRVIDLEIDDGKTAIAFFVRVEPVALTVTSSGTVPR